MKKFAVLLPMVVFLMIPATLFSQSLADLAEKEKERREQIGKAKTITDRDLNYGEGDGTEPAVDSPAKPAEKPDSQETEKDSGKQAKSGEKKADPDEPVDFEGRPESFWRKSMGDARQKVKDLENQANVLTLKLNDLQMQFYREDDGFKRESIQREIQKAIYEQDQNKDNLAKAKDALQDLEKEARKSGALPGWIEGR